MMPGKLLEVKMARVLHRKCDLCSTFLNLSSINTLSKTVV